LEDKSLTKFKNLLSYFMNSSIESVDISDDSMIIISQNKLLQFHTTPIGDKRIFKLISYAENEIKNYTLLDACMNNFRIKNNENDIIIVINSKEVNMNDYNEILDKYIDPQNKFASLTLITSETDIDYYIEFLKELSTVVNVDINHYIDFINYGYEKNIVMSVEYGLSNICNPVNLRIKIGKDFIRLPTKYDTEFYKKIFLEHNNISIYDKCKYEWATVRDVVVINKTLYINYMGEPIKLPKYWLTNSYTYKNFKINVKKGIIFTTENMYNIMKRANVSFRNLTTSDFIINTTKLNLPGIDKIIIKDGEIVGVIPLYRLILSENKYLMLQNIVDSILMQTY